MPPQVALATCAAMPELDEDGAPLIAALAELEVAGRPAIWTDPSVTWGAFDLVVLRCTWDYVEHHQAFLQWVRSVPKLANRASVVEWNTDKHYLADLASAGVPTVETVFLEPGDAGAEPEVPFADRRFVVKPAVSAGSRETARYEPTDVALARQHVADLRASGRSVMVQPYLDEIDAAGETALIFLGGRYSHAIGKAALLTGTERHITALWRPEGISAREASADERTVADETLAAVAGLVDGGDQLVYARVDLVRDNNGSAVVLEVELTEPSLFLDRGDGAPQRFAKAIAGHLSNDD